MYYSGCKSYLSSNLNAQGGAISAHAYQYNAANQRVQATLADGTSWSYTYDNLGQVTGGQRFWEDGTPVAG